MDHKKEMFCNFCKEEIDYDDPDERYVLLGTYQNNNILEEKFYHMGCWIKRYNEGVKKTAKHQVQNIQKKVKTGILDNPTIAGLLQRFSGGGLLQDMATIDLDKEIPDFKGSVDDINKKKKNGKPKKKSKK